MAGFRVTGDFNRLAALIQRFRATASPQSYRALLDTWGDGGLFTTRMDTTAVTARSVRVHAYNGRELRALTRACPVLAQRLLRTGTERGGSQRTTGHRAHSDPDRGPAALPAGVPDADSDG